MKANKTLLDELFPIETKKTYFDELPEEMQLVVADFLEAVKVHNEEFMYTGDRIRFDDLDEVECRRRDGFIPHDYNKGGLQLNGWLSLYDFYFGEFHLGGKAGKVIKQMSDISLKMARETFIEQNSASMTKFNLKEKDIDYHKLYEKGLSALAERWSEYEMENLNSDQESTLHQVRVMYDGQGTFAIDVMHRISDAPYHRTCDAFKEFKVKANDVDSLVKGLAKVYDKVIKAYL
jgi:hypothetical protein